MSSPNSTGLHQIVIPVQLFRLGSRWFVTRDGDYRNVRRRAGADGFHEPLAVHTRHHQWGAPGRFDGSDLHQTRPQPGPGAAREVTHDRSFCRRRPRTALRIAELDPPRCVRSFQSVVTLFSKARGGQSGRCPYSGCQGVGRGLPDSRAWM